MQAYTRFAEVYDTFMDNVPYEEWAEYMIQLLKEYQVEDGVVVELGCGTGSMTRLLSAQGYDMIGIDNSYDMLEIARDREYEDMYEDTYEEESFIDSSYTEESEDNGLEVENFYQDEVFEETHTGSQDEYEEELQVYGQPNGILYLEQDMREFELYGTAKAIISVCDSINYITSEEDLLKVFQLVNNYLDKDGVFIFDMNTEYKYNVLLGDNTIAENREDCSFIWENYFDKTTNINEYHVTIYVNASDDLEEVKSKDRVLYERFEETHYQKAYEINKVIELIEKAGLEFVAVYDAFTKNKPQETSERVYFIAKEKVQSQKSYEYEGQV